MLGGLITLRLGMGANLKIMTLEKEGVLLVPHRAEKGGESCGW
jgi:hypothetical protein